MDIWVIYVRILFYLQIGLCCILDKYSSIYFLSLFRRTAWYFSFIFTEVMAFFYELAVIIFCLSHCIFIRVLRGQCLCLSPSLTDTGKSNTSTTLANIYGQNIYVLQKTCVMCISSLFSFNSGLHCKNKGKEEIHSLRMFWVQSLIAKAYKQW